METTITLDLDQTEFLTTALKWWKDSGVNYWSAKSAQEILELLTDAQMRKVCDCGETATLFTSRGSYCSEAHAPAWVQNVRAKA